MPRSTPSLFDTLLHAFSQLGENLSAARLYPIFPKHFVLFVWFYSWRGVVKSKDKVNNNLRQGLLFLYVYFLFSIFHPNRPKKRGKESRVLKKPIIFCAEINETITKLSWKFEENQTSGWFYFSNKKKEHKKRNPLPNFMELLQAVKMFNSISQERLNFRRRQFLCTTLYRIPGFSILITVLNS